MNINCICSNLRQMSLKNYAIYLGEGGRSFKDHIGSQGGGGNWAKKDRIIFYRSLIVDRFLLSDNIDVLILWLIAKFQMYEQHIHNESLFFEEN